MKLLVLEKESTFCAEDFSISEFMEIYPGPVEALFNIAELDDDEITSKIEDSTDLAFQTLFDNELEIERIFNILKNVENSVRIYIPYIRLKQRLSQLFTIDELYPLIKKHQIFELNTLDKQHTEISFTDEIKWAKKIENSYLKTQQSQQFNFTGRKIQILNYMGFDNEARHLRSGMIVNEINCSDLESQSLRLPSYITGTSGVWIWGKTKPVKLKNRNYLREYKILEKISVEETILEIIKVFSNTNNIANFRPFVNRILNSKIDAMTKASLICNFIGITDEINQYYLRDIISQG